MGEITDRMVFRGEGRGYQSSTECKEEASEGEGGRLDTNMTEPEVGMLSWHNQIPSTLPFFPLQAINKDPSLNDYFKKQEYSEERDFTIFIVVK